MNIDKLPEVVIVTLLIAIACVLIVWSYVEFKEMVSQREECEYSGGILVETKSYEGDDYICLNPDAIIAMKEKTR